MSGGGGGSSNTTQTTKVEPPPQLAPYLAPFMQQASSVAMRPYEQYGGDRVAGFNQNQQYGFDLARETADQSRWRLQNASNQLDSTAKGNYLDSYRPGQSTAGTNALLGMDNPYLQSAIDASQGDVVRNFNNSVANNTDATMARSGAFGGSAWQQAQSENANQLAQNLGRVSNDMRMQDYALQAQLGESDLNRQLQNQQFNVGMQDQAYQTERARMLQAAGLQPSLTQAKYANAQGMLGIGDAQQAQQQGQLDMQYGDWLNQQNYPTQQLDVMANAIRTIMGGGGTTTATGPNPYQRSGTASALGGAIGGGTLGMQLGGPMGGAVGAGLGLLGGLL